MMCGESASPGVRCSRVQQNASGLPNMSKNGSKMGRDAPAQAWGATGSMSCPHVLLSHRTVTPQVASSHCAPLQAAALSELLRWSRSGLIAQDIHPRGVWTPVKGRHDVRSFRPTSRAPQAEFFWPTATGAPSQTSATRGKRPQSRFVQPVFQMSACRSHPRT